MCLLERDRGISQLDLDLLKCSLVVLHPSQYCFEVRRIVHRYRYLQLDQLDDPGAFVIIAFYCISEVHATVVVFWTVIFVT